MKIELNNTTENEVEYVEKIDKRDSSFKKFRFLIIIACLAFSFMVWCYANYIDDPIIQKKVNVHLNYNGLGIIECNSQYIVIYGEESKLSSVTEIKVVVDRNSFNQNNKKVVYKINNILPEDVYSHQEEIVVELIE